MICSLSVAAQSPGTIRGRVLDSASNQRLSNVMVTVEGTGIGVFTNLEGTFTLTRVPAGARQVRARRIGYNPTAVTVTASVQAVNTATGDLRLAPHAAVLTERTAALRRLLVSVPVDCPFHH